MIEVRTWDKNFLLVHMAHISLISSLVVGMGWEQFFIWVMLLIAWIVDLI